jgi:hypothetical protein
MMTNEELAAAYERWEERPWIKGRLPLHMVEALPLRSVWVGRKPPRGCPPLIHWWLKGALLCLASAALAVAVVRILRAGLL